MRIKLMFAFVALLMAPSIVKADHSLPGGSLSRLQNDTHYLEYQVRNSYLKYQVKQATYRLLLEVNALSQCIGQREETRDHDTVPENCEYRFRYVRQAWVPVNQYLYDTYYDYPRIYQAYLRVRQDIQVLP